MGKLRKEPSKNLGKAMKRALITGITGQDGSYLAELLLEKGYEVHGLIRRSSTFNRQRIEGLDIKLHYGDMTDPFSLMWALKASQPDEVYNLAAQSHVQVSWETPLYTAQTTGIGVLNLLEAIRVLGISPRIYQASTSELYDGLEAPQTEDTPFNPVSPYGTAKLYGYQLAKNYRDAYGMFICNGILFNHESPRRGVNFVTQKIVQEADKGEVHLGNTDAKRDWGYAPEFMEQAWLMLQQDEPDDYIVATGETNSIEQFVKWVEEEAGHEIKIIKDKDYIRPVDVPTLCGKPKKAQEKLGWVPKVKAKELAKIMYQERNSTKL